MASLTKKHFEQLAKIIGEHQAQMFERHGADNGSGVLLNNVCRFCIENGPTFDVDKFHYRVDEVRNARIR